MYLIHRSKPFKKSFSKFKRSGASKKILDDIALVIDMLARGEVLDEKYRDHRYKFNSADICTDCFIRNT
ncbi:MAG: type II toxin-antitoxin system YafQ family toxin [Candidatus Yonathbacteria bacterium]|nr:type II toxin-antitoxin system YafQ family toxin [Candidatus Yonathbacteria bacterium]